MSSALTDRFVLLLREQAVAIDHDIPSEGEVLFSATAKRSTQPALAGRGFWVKLSERTGIAPLSWRNAYARRQRPTADMIEAVARLWPQYAFWLATGITDAANGHVAPMTALTFPERFYGEGPWAREYFRMSLQLAERLYAEGGVDLSNDAARTAAIERERPFSQWVGGQLVDVAYELVDSEEYGQLVAAWEEREKGRIAQLERIQGNRPWERTQKKRHGDAVLGGDPRTAHQSSWDLFYKPQPDQDDAGG